MTNAPRSRLTLRPGAPGTKEAVATYGERLVMVRYRYAAERGVRIKTVELTVEEVPRRVVHTLDIVDKVIQRLGAGRGG